MGHGAYCHGLVTGDTLEEKLASPPRQLVVQAWHGQLPMAPGRPERLALMPHRKVKVPPIAGMADPNQRARILHALANHELQAIELFAWALLRFEGLPEKFVRGAIAIIAEEQKHLQLYLDRLAAHDCEFGDHPVTAHFWHHLAAVETPVDFLCLMGMTFENANLDFAQEYAAAALTAGDEQTASVLAVVHEDEIRHVRFSWRWLNEWTGDAEAAFDEHVAFPFGLGRARGRTFCRESRQRAGLSESFIARLEAARAKRPGGGPR